MFRTLDDRRRCSRWIVTLILLLALSIRVGWALSRQTDEVSLANLPDQVEYLTLARSVLAGSGLQMIDPRFGETVRAFRMPGYPLFCAAAGGHLTAIRLAQAVVDASTVLATLWLARRWLSPALAYLAALFVALDPIQVYFSSLILSETIFTALVTWGVAFLAHGRSPLARGTGGATWWIGIGLLILSIYVRPAAIIWPLLIGGASVIHEHGSFTFKAGGRIPVMMLLGLATGVALLPWAIRNRAVLGELVFTTTNNGFTLYDAWNADADGSSNQSGLARMPLLQGLNEVQRSRYLGSLASNRVAAQPSQLLLNLPRNLGRLWTPWPLSREFSSKRLYVIGAASHAIPLFTLALIGVLLSGAIPRGGKLLLLSPVLLVTISYGLTLGSLRYRMPVHPELAVLAASAFLRPAKAKLGSDGT